MPAFAFRHTKDLYPVFWDKSRKLVKALISVARQEGKETVESIKDAPVVEIGGWGSRAGTSYVNIHLPLVIFIICILHIIAMGY